LMLVLVAAEAVAAQAEEGPVQVLDPDLGLGAGRNVRGRVALLARLFSVLPRQREPGLRLVIELRAIQADQRRGLSFVLRVAPAAVGLPYRGFVVARVESRLGIHPAPDLGVALQALEPPRARPELVTRPALGDALQLLVGPRQRTGRHLRPRCHSPAHRQQNGEERFPGAVAQVAAQHIHSRPAAKPCSVFSIAGTRIP